MLILSKIRFYWPTTAVVALVFAGLAPRTASGTPIEGSPTITHGSFVSPDGFFAFEVLDDSHHYKFQVENRKTGKIFDKAFAHYSSLERTWGKFNILTPIFFIRWTGDSKSILIISHIAGGTQPQIFHFDGKDWSDLFANPPHETHYKSSVLSQEVGENTIKLNLAVYPTQVNGMAVDPYETTFKVDPETGKYSHLSRKPLDERWVLSGPEFN